MDPTKEPGIRLTGVVVERIRFDDIPAAATEKPKALQRFIRIERRRMAGDGVAEVALHVAIRAAVEEKIPFSLEISMAGRFEQDPSAVNMTMDEFVRINAPTMIIPYVREFVTNITVRSRHGTIFLPAINVVDLVRREEDRAAGQAPQ